MICEICYGISAGLEKVTVQSRQKQFAIFVKFVHTY